MGSGVRKVGSVIVMREFWERWRIDCMKMGRKKIVLDIVGGFFGESV